MISVIMPTMWEGKEGLTTIEKLNELQSVGEIIVIDNSEPMANPFFSEYPDLSGYKKVVHIKEGKNTFVNPAWNKGWKLAKFDKLLFVNDDVITDWSFVDKLEEYITADRGMIGAGVSCWQGPYNHSGVVPAHNRPNCYGCVFAMHKDSYVEIPEDLKIHYGDDWLFTKSGKGNYEIRGWQMSGESEQTSGQAKYNSIKEYDRHLRINKYQS